jgi:hypothetical protein
MDLDLLIKAAAATAAITSAMVGLNKWRNSKFRSKLKADLEILKLYREACGEERQRQLLENEIQKTLFEGYREKAPPDRRAWFLFVLSTFVTALGLFGFVRYGLSPMLALLLVSSTGLAIFSFRRLRV